jgi:hypothetical protein
MAAPPLYDGLVESRVSGIESAKLKLARVAVHLNEIRHLISEFTKERHTCEIVKDANGKDTVNFLVGPPRDVLVIAGEIVYQFKSTLDHLAFELVQSNPGRKPLPTRWERDCNFPLMLEVPTFGNVEPRAIGIEMRTVMMKASAGGPFHRVLCD